MMARLFRFSPGIAAGFVVAASLTAAPTALGCSCVGPDPKTGYADFLKASDGAVVAKLVDVRPIGDGGSSSYVYRVRQVFKRPNRFEPGEVRRVVASTSSASCGISYPVGSTHGVFLYRQGDHFTSSLCSTIPARKMREAAAAGSRGRVARPVAAPADGGCRAGSSRSSPL